ncbi:uncharacterized protein CXQ87_004080 [Candidozyma duobushaemuli]|uniref:Calcineurin-like phosphoesterase domain-containing protein n=1 Tax=Candidozyma duobushaemuli TaxID=1231522 RepID=A0A2V1ADQ6_9ASCO|nr:uncharacterized protein CXQ87_004080 [[Candida] duobushaemulonis]PVH16210.1 hypothetical protein CXQ87_004080 [[Candida] duobushaemulonis]
MVALPKRWIRNISYLAGALVILCLLFFVAQEQNLVSPTLNLNYWGEELKSRRLYIRDITVETCLRATNQRCRNKKLKAFALRKDLSLGSSWVYRSNLNLRFTGPNAANKIIDDVVVDIAVGNPETDGKIKNNQNLLIPEKVLKDIHKSRVYSGDDRTQIEEGNKDEKLDAKVDPDEIMRLKQEQESQAEDLRAATEKEKESKSKEGEANKQVEEVKESADDNSEEAVEDKPKEEISEEAQEEESGNQKRETHKTYHTLNGYYLIPTPEQLEKARWINRGHGIWIKKGPVSADAVRWVNVVYGPDATVHEEKVEILESPLQDTGAPKGLEPRLVVNRGEPSSPEKKLRFNKDGKFKILQIADAHFSTGVGKCRDPEPPESAKGCEADPRTIRFIEKVLDIEKPDFVALTGDQIFGDDAPDPQTALWKLVTPLEKRKIPYGLVLGNHDDQSTMNREQLMDWASYLPHSMAAKGPEEVDGFGNYGITVRSSHMSQKVAAALYFLDSHSYSTQPKIAGGYDWFKDSQAWWLEQESGLMAEQMVKKNGLSMAFFHIPIPEFKNLDGQAFVGKHLEGVASPKYNSGMRTHLANAKVQVAAVGHDHCNDYCLLDVENAGSEEHESKVWLCYGGGVGEGGYGGYDGYIRRMRVYDLDENEGSIRSWKRAENNPDFVFDKQRIVQGGKAVNLPE